MYTMLEMFDAVLTSMIKPFDVESMYDKAVIGNIPEKIDELKLIPPNSKLYIKSIENIIERSKLILAINVDIIALNILINTVNQTGGRLDINNEISVLNALITQTNTQNLAITQANTDGLALDPAYVTQPLIVLDLSADIANINTKILNLNSTNTDTTTYPIINTITATDYTIPIPLVPAPLNQEEVNAAREEMNALIMEINTKMEKYNSINPYRAEDLVYLLQNITVPVVAIPLKLDQNQIDQIYWVKLTFVDLIPIIEKYLIDIPKMYSERLKSLTSDASTVAAATMFKNELAIIDFNEPRFSNDVEDIFQSILTSKADVDTNVNDIKTKLSSIYGITGNLLTAFNVDYIPDNTLTTVANSYNIVNDGLNLGRISAELSYKTMTDKDAEERFRIEVKGKELLSFAFLRGFLDLDTDSRLLYNKLLDFRKLDTYELQKLDHV